jgi:hypothetical protein
MMAGIGVMANADVLEKSIDVPESLAVELANIQPVNGVCEANGNCYIESDSINGLYALSRDYNYPDEFVYGYKSSDKISKMTQQVCCEATGLDIRIYYSTELNEYVISVTSNLENVFWWYSSYFYSVLNGQTALNEITEPTCSRASICPWCYSPITWTSGYGGTVRILYSGRCERLKFLNFYNFLDFARVSLDADLQDIADFCDLWLELVEE